ncbi:hypothetical protein AAFB76_002483 [Enterococcus faecalis]
MFIKKNIYRAWFLRINNLFLFKVTETEANDFATNIPKEEFYLLYPIQSWRLYLLSEEKLKVLRRSALAEHVRTQSKLES